MRRGRRAGQVLPEFHEREPAAVSPMPGMNIRPVFASALRPVRGGTTLRAEYSSLPLSYLPLSELRIPNLTPPPSQCPRLSHSTLLYSRVDIAKGSHHTFSSLFRDGNGGYSKRLPPGPGDATFRRGRHLSKALLSGRCPFGAFRLACARGEIGETVHTTTMPLGRNAQLFGEVGIFPSQHCSETRGFGDGILFCVS